MYRTADIVGISELQAYNRSYCTNLLGLRNYYGMISNYCYTEAVGQRQQEKIERDIDSETERKRVGYFSLNPYALCFTIHRYWIGLVETGYSNSYQKIDIRQSF